MLVVTLTRRFLSALLFEQGANLLTAISAYDYIASTREYHNLVTTNLKTVSKRHQSFLENSCVPNFLELYLHINYFP